MILIRDQLNHTRNYFLVVAMAMLNSYDQNMDLNRVDTALTKLYITSDSDGSLYSPFLYIYVGVSPIYKIHWNMDFSELSISRFCILINHSHC